MPAQRSSMRLIREVLRLKHDANLSQRRIARSLNIGLGTVSHYLKKAKAAGLEWPLPTDLDEAELERRLFPNQLQSVRSGLVETDYAGMSTSKSRVRTGTNTHSTASVIVTGY
jgi:transposase